MKDRYGRVIDYMRISITDRCNLRCVYCMPDGCDWIEMDQILTYEEILLICEQAVELGIHKFKITGGEPLVRKGCVDLIRRIKALKGVEQVTLTTNGVLLSEYAEALKDAGIDAINISLDTTEKRLFEQITGRDHLANVLDGMKKAIAYKIPVKINTVLQKGFNDHCWKELLELAKEDPVDVRFIELMPIGSGNSEILIANDQLKEQIREVYGKLIEDKKVHGNGPAIYYSIPGFKGSIGFISAIHGKFCDSCNRIRLTSTGELKACLCYESNCSLREAARAKEREVVKERLRSVIESKPKMHCFDKKEQITEWKKMTQIGG